MSRPDPWGRAISFSHNCLFDDVSHTFFSELPFGHCVVQFDPFVALSKDTAPSPVGVTPPTGSTQPPMEPVQGVAPPPTGSAQGVAPPPMGSTQGVVPPPMGSAQGVVPPPTGSAQGVAPPPTGSAQGVVPPPMGSTQGVVPPPTGSAQGVVPPPMGSTQGVIPPPTGSAQGVAPPPTGSAQGVAPPPTGSAQGVAPPPMGSAQGVVPDPLGCLAPADSSPLVRDGVVYLVVQVENTLIRNCPVMLGVLPRGFNNSEISIAVDAIVWHTEKCYKIINKNYIPATEYGVPCPRNENGSTLYDKDTTRKNWTNDSYYVYNHNDTNYKIGVGWDSEAKELFFVKENSPVNKNFRVDLFESNLVLTLIFPAVGVRVTLADPGDPLSFNERHHKETWLRNLEKKPAPEFRPEIFPRDIWNQFLENILLGGRISYLSQTSRKIQNLIKNYSLRNFGSDFLQQKINWLKFLNFNFYSMSSAEYFVERGFDFLVSQNSPHARLPTAVFRGFSNTFKKTFSARNYDVKLLCNSVWAENSEIFEILVEFLKIGDDWRKVSEETVKAGKLHLFERLMVFEGVPKDYRLVILALMKSKREEEWLRLVEDKLTPQIRTEALLSAAENRHYKGIKWLIEQGGASPAEWNPSAFFHFIEKPDSLSRDCVKFLRERGFVLVPGFKFSKDMSSLKFITEDGWEMLMEDANDEQKVEILYQVINTNVLINLVPKVNFSSYDKKMNFYSLAIDHHGSEALLLALLDKGVEIGADEWFEHRLLHSAIKRNFFVGVKRLIEAGALLNLQDKQGKTPLHLAVEFGHMNILSYLLSVGTVDLEVKDEKGKTPLCIAVEKNFLEIFKLLFHAGASLSFEPPPIFLAIYNSSLSMLNLLLDLGVDPNTSFEETTPIHIAYKLKKWNLVHVLVQRGADVERKKETEKSLLEIVFEGYHVGHPFFPLLWPYCTPDRFPAATARFLLNIDDSGLDHSRNLFRVNPVDPNAACRGTTPLFRACSRPNSARVVTWLLEIGARPEVAIDPQGNTVLHSAVRRNTEILFYLEKFGRDFIHMKNKNSETVLHVAAKNQNAAAVRVLLGWPGVDPNALDGAGYTPLMRACMGGGVEAVKAFLEYPGVDVNIRDPEGNTGVMVAVLYGSRLALEEWWKIILRSYGKMNRTIFMACNNSGGNGLSLALENRRMRLIWFFLRNFPELAFTDSVKSNTLPRTNGTMCEIASFIEKINRRK